MPSEKLTSRDIANLTPEELAELDDLLMQSGEVWLPIPDSPQEMAVNSEADIIGFGGAAGGGKSNLVVGLSLTRHRRTLILRKEKTQTEGIVQEIARTLGTRDGYSGQKSRWEHDGRLIEFGGLDNPGDEHRYQGRPHDLKAFDEVTEMREGQVRFAMGWNRSDDPDVKCQVLMTFNPPTNSDGEWVIEFFGPWLDKDHPNPAEPGELRWFTTIAGRDKEVTDRRPFVIIDGEPKYNFNSADYAPEEIITPRSRTFIPSRVVDNPYYMETGYMATLQALPEPLRSQMLFGDFMAGRRDSEYQVIPTAWVDLAMNRWTKPPKLPPMDMMGIDVARGGKDETLLARRHGMWFDEPLAYPGRDTPDGQEVAGLAIAAIRDRSPMAIDVVGVGGSPYDILKESQQVIPVNGGLSSDETAQATGVRLCSLKTVLWWRMREALDPTQNTGICLPKSKKLRADLLAMRWKATAQGIRVETRDETIKRLGRSPDYGSAYVMALMKRPKRRTQLEELMARNSASDPWRNYHPLNSMPRNGHQQQYNPLDNFR